MPHAPTFAPFRPSPKEAELYGQEWRTPDNIEYLNYQLLTEAFQNHAMTRSALQQKCDEIIRVYHHRMPHIIRPMAVNRILTVDPQGVRIKTGDTSVVDEIKVFGGTNNIVFATMFCHHSNLQKFLGYSNPVCRIMFELNKRDQFC